MLQREFVIFISITILNIIHRKSLFNQIKNVSLWQIINIKNN